jgi:hypothetical protein
MSAALIAVLIKPFVVLMLTSVVEFCKTIKH